ncbi:OB-fold protein [Alistipes sp. ZOR0009]|uniref:OB-fold protein n=1 Tax=Alistipes sp. ZOR0009 TaxID=1339253 RepID=UPI0006475723|nr:hypothetical protein [Alistipes sp. ZOR0009]
MKRIILMMLCVMLASSYIFAQKKAGTATITANEFYANAPKYKGQTVIVKGVVKHICSRSFQKLFLTTDDGKGFVRVNIEGKDKFAKNLIGKDIAIVGKVEALELATAKGCDGGKACDDDKKASADGKTIYYVLCQSYAVE